MGWNVCPASGKFGVRIPAATELSRKKGSESSTVKRSLIDVSVTGHRRWQLKTNAPCPAVGIAR